MNQQPFDPENKVDVRWYPGIATCDCVYRDSIGHNRPFSGCFLGCYILAMVHQTSLYDKYRAGGGGYGQRNEIELRELAGIAHARTGGTPAGNRHLMVRLTSIMFVSPAAVD